MSQNYHTAIALGAPADSATFNAPLGQLDSAIYDFASGVLTFNNFGFVIGNTLTISGGAVSIANAVHGINTELGASTDDLATINGGQDGDLLFLFPAFAGRTVVLKHSTGNIWLNGGVDIGLDSEKKTILLIRHNSVWSDIAFGSVPASGTLISRTELSIDGTIGITLPSSSYTLAEVYLELRSDYGVNKYDDIRITFNSDTTAANYENQTIYEINTGGTAAFYTGTEAGLRFDRAATNDASPADHVAVLTLQIFNFRDSTIYRNVVLTGMTPGDSVAADFYYNMGGGQWKDVANAITSIQVTPVNGTNFKAGSAYMVKGY